MEKVSDNEKKLLVTKYEVRIVKYELQEQFWVHSISEKLITLKSLLHEKTLPLFS